MNRIAWAWVAALVACSHAETVAPRSKPQPEDVPQLPNPRQATPKTEPGHAPLAGGPTVMLKPGAADALAGQLRARGLMAREASSPTELARSLRAFQKAEGLAETGFPDRETVRRLGLDPRDIDATIEGAEEKKEKAADTGQ